MTDPLTPERRKLLLDRLAAGQTAHPSLRPSRATRTLAKEAFEELCERDEAFAKRIKQARQGQRPRGGARFIVSTENGYTGFRRRHRATQQYNLFRDLCEPGQAVILSKVLRRGGMKVLREYVAPAPSCESEVSVRTDPAKGNS